MAWELPHKKYRFKVATKPHGFPRPFFDRL
jgi:hypothetical protein